MTCISRSGFERRQHTWDKDHVCIFCDRVAGNVSEDDLTPRALARKKGAEADRRATLDLLELQRRERRAAKRAEGQRWHLTLAEPRPGQELKPREST